MTTKYYTRTISVVDDINAIEMWFDVKTTDPVFSGGELHIITSCIRLQDHPRFDFLRSDNGIITGVGSYGT